jgi:peptide/nickel transport system permease protein
MRNYLIRRLGRLILVWFGVTLVTFLLLRLTGDPARVVLGELASEQAVKEYNRLHGLDRPWPEQYLTYIGGVLHGDFGRSLRYAEPILPIILERIPASAELAGASLALSFVLGVTLGIIAALWRDSPVDYVVRALVLFAQGLPNFFLAILFILFFGVYLHWLPTGGRGGWQNLILPATVLSFVLMPLTVRVTRSAMLDMISQNYVCTARGKGLRESTVIWRHVIRNAALPIITILGVQTASLLSGAIVTETVFSWPGIGRLIVSAIFARDFPLVQSAVLIISMTVVIINFVVDLLYGILDPRISLS